MNNNEKLQQDTNTLIMSVGQAHAGAVRARAAGDYHQLHLIITTVINQDGINGDATDYHNLSVEVSRNDDYDNAFLIVEKGIGQYPRNVDLLADAIKYGCDSIYYERCETYLNTLLKIPYALWNWRAFAFVNDYYICMVQRTEEYDDMTEFIKKALKNAKVQQGMLPNEEKGYLAEYEAFCMLARFYTDVANDKDSDQADSSDDAQRQEAITTAAKYNQEAEDALKTAIDRNDISAVQCCVKYADLLFEKQRYDETITICNKALQYGEAQSSARLGYFLYLSGQSKDVLLHKDKAFKDKERVNDVYADYIAAHELLQESPAYIKIIENRSVILAAKSGIPSPFRGAFM